jgi:hypothetical protein
MQESVEGRSDNEEREQIGHGQEPEGAQGSSGATRKKAGRLTTMNGEENDTEDQEPSKRSVETGEVKGNTASESERALVELQRKERERLAKVARDKLESQCPFCETAKNCKALKGIPTTRGVGGKGTFRASQGEVQWER